MKRGGQGPIFFARAVPKPLRRALASSEIITPAQSYEILTLLKVNFRSIDVVTVPFQSCCFEVDVCRLLNQYL